MRKERSQIMQSKRWIAEALLRLMKEHDYDSITVKDIARNADLDRKTFYRHFKTKEDVLKLPLEEASGKYLEDLKALPELSSHTVTEAYFEVCIEYLDLFTALNKSGQFFRLMDIFNQCLLTLNNYFAENHPTYCRKSEAEILYQAGGFWNITKYWLENGAVQTPAEMAVIIGRLMPPTLIDNDS